MKYFVDEKLFSLHDRFYVRDEQGNPAFQITSELFRIGAHISILDNQGGVLARVEQELLHLMPCYRIYLGGNFVCKINRKFSFVSHSYTLTNGYRVEGNIWSCDFRVIDSSNHVVGQISRQFWTLFGDKYTLEIFDEKDHALILAILMAITKDVNNAQNSNS